MNHAKDTGDEVRIFPNKIGEKHELLTTDTKKMFPFLDVTAEKFLAYNPGDKKKIHKKTGLTFHFTKPKINNRLNLEGTVLFWGGGNKLL